MGLSSLFRLDKNPVKLQENPLNLRSFFQFHSTKFTFIVYGILPEHLCMLRAAFQSSNE